MFSWSLFSFHELLNSSCISSEVLPSNEFFGVGQINADNRIYIFFTWKKDMTRNLAFAIR